MARPSSIVVANGFSTYTSFPAWQAITVGKACQWSGVAMSTTSTSFRSSTRRKSRVVSGFLLRLAWQISTAFAAMASSTSQMTAQSTSGFRKKHSRSPRPMPPAPITPSLTLELGPGSAARNELMNGPDRVLRATGARVAAKVDWCKNRRRDRAFIFLSKVSPLNPGRSLTS